MNITGCTLITYQQLYPVLARTLRLRGITTFRLVSHDQTSWWMHGLLYPTPFTTLGRDLCAQMDAECVCTLNHLALPKRNSWSTPATSFEETSFKAWIKAYIQYMFDGGVKLLVMDFGNEPDADNNPFINNEAEFRARYKAFAEACADYLSLNPNAKLVIGGGGYCVDWTRAASFVQWTAAQGLRLDFLSVHIYGDPNRVLAANAAVRAISAVPLWIMESGCDWQAGNPSYASPAQQVAWKNSFGLACDLAAVLRWHVMHSWVDANYPPAPAPYLSLMSDTAGHLTPLGSAP